MLFDNLHIIVEKIRCIYDVFKQNPSGIHDPIWLIFSLFPALILQNLVGVNQLSDRGIVIDKKRLSPDGKRERYEIIKLAVRGSKQSHIIPIGDGFAFLRKIHIISLQPHRKPLAQRDFLTIQDYDNNE